MSLPAAFISYLHLMVERTGTLARARSVIVDRFYAGATIPGYDQLPKEHRSLPRGWSYANLARFKPAPALRLPRVGAR